MKRTQLPALTLEPEQMKAVEKIISENTKAALNASLMGTGKTLMGVEATLRLGAKVTLIIGPLNTYWGWYDTIQRQTGYTQRVVRIDSTKNGKQAMADLHAGIDGWYFIGREYFRTQEWQKVKPNMVMLDECHFAQNRKSKSFKTLMHLKSDFKLSMSGTPYGNKFDGAWAVTRWLWPSIIPGSFWKWVDKWALTAYSPFSGKEVLRELNQGKFSESLPCYIRLEANHNLDVVEETRYVDLLPSQRKLYDKFEKDLVVFLEGNPMIAEVPIAARIRLRQITLAVPSITDDNEVVFDEDAKSTKFNALKEIIDDNPDEPMLILTDSQKYANLVTNRLNAKDVVAFEWSGKANQAQRTAAQAAFLGGEIKYIVAVIPAIAEGVDGLQNVCSTIVWLSHSDSNLMNQQVVERIRRRGQKNVVKIYDIIARDTFDDPQAETLLRREMNMKASLNENKR